MSDLQDYFSIIYDANEPQKIKDKLNAHPLLIATQSSLEVFDYLIAQFGIERKTCSDCCSSVVDNRLLEQCEKMHRYAMEYPDTIPILLTEGSWYWTLNYRKMDQRQIDGLFHKIAVQYPSIRHVHTSSMSATIKFFERIAKHCMGQEDILYDHIQRMKGFANKSDSYKQLFIIQGLPGIGTLTATRLLEVERSVERVFEKLGRESAAWPFFKGKRLAEARRIYKVEYNG